MTMYPCVCIAMPSDNTVYDNSEMPFNHLTNHQPPVEIKPVRQNFTDKKKIIITDGIVTMTEVIYLMNKHPLIWVDITVLLNLTLPGLNHDDVIEWKRFLRYWPLVRGIHRSPVKSPHKGQWRGDLLFSLICVWINAIVPIMTSL